MSIVSIATVQNELPTGSTVLQSDVDQATSFINSHTSIHYDPFDDYLASPDTIIAPDVIGRFCIEIAKIFYLSRINQRNRKTEDNEYYQKVLTFYKNELLKINISPTWESQSITLSATYKTMLLSYTHSQSGSNFFIRVLPLSVKITSATTNTWINGYHFNIRKGYILQNEQPEGWYLDSNLGYTVEGTIKYMRTYRNDEMDYMRYNNVVNNITGNQYVIHSTTI